MRKKVEQLRLYEKVKAYPEIDRYYTVVAIKADMRLSVPPARRLSVVGVFVTFMNENKTKFDIFYETDAEVEVAEV